jgi:uncharacterized protein (UPF0548 family)
VISFRKPSAATLERLVAEQSRELLTYAAVGATASGEHPAGYRHDRWQIDLGPDADDLFERCAEALRKWAPQRGAGISISPDRPVERDLTFALLICLPFGFVTAAGRVVYVVDEPDRAGFAYGTLPAHPEEGEEAFLILRREGRVRFEVTAFSKPCHPLARLGAPVARFLQLRTNRTYLDVMRRVAQGDGS